MSELLTRPKAPVPAEALDDLDAGVEVSPSDILERLWRLFISMRFGLVLILGLGLLSLAGTLLAQAPAGLRDDPQGYATWLDSIRPKYGGWTAVLDKLGLLSVFGSLWFKGLVVLLATSLIACSINRTPLLWNRAVHPQKRRSDSFFEHTALRGSVTAPTTPAVALEDVRKVLRAWHFRTVDDPAGGALNLYADRYRWAPFGTVVTHLSFVLILVGFVLSATTGFKESDLAVPVGAQVPVGHGTGLTVEATAFSDTYYPDGSPKEYASDLVLYKDGKRVAAQTVRVNHPMRFDGVAIFQSFFGVAASMRVTDAAGKVVFAEGVPMRWQSDDGTHSIGRFAIPSKGLTVFVVTAASGQVDPTIKAGQVQLEIYDSSSADTPIGTQVVSQGKEQSVGGLSYTFERTRQFTGLSVARDPGATFVWIGSALMTVGIILVLFFPHRRLWVKVRSTAAGTEVSCAAARGGSAHRDTTYEASFHKLVDDMQLAVTRTGSQESRAQRC